MPSLGTEIEVISFTSPAALLAQTNQQPPQLLCCDFRDTAWLKGVDFIQRVRRLPHCDELPLLIIANQENYEIRYQALAAGANDLVIYPFDDREFQLRCKQLLQLQQTQRAHLKYIRHLRQQLGKATRQIRSREHEILMRLAKAGEYRDEQTGSHVTRMAKYCQLLAEELGLTAEYSADIGLAAPMHDIGKIGIPDDILLKPGRHTAAETHIMRTHSKIGYDILKDSPSRFLQLGAVIALAHHEKWDGSGYPYGLKNDEIPLPARIVAIADTYDALTSPRPYKIAWSNQDAAAYIHANAGRHFDPNCVKAFTNRIRDIQQIQTCLYDHPAMQA